MGSLLGSCCCLRLGDLCQTDSRNSRLPYILTFVAFSILCVIFNLVDDQQISQLPFYNANGCAESCSRNGAIYRIGLCLVIFFSTHFIILFIPGTGCFQTFVYLIKFVILSALVIWSFWWENSAVDKFADTARWFSLFFLIVQGLTLLSWGWDTHDSMITRMIGEDGGDAEPMLKYCYIGICVSLTVTSFIMIGFFYAEYTGSGNECSAPKTMLSLTLIFCALETAASYFIEYANVFSSSIAVVYVTLLNYQALGTYTNDDCEDPSWSDDAPRYIGLVVLLSTLSYIGYETRLLNEDERHDIANEDADILSGYKTAGDAHNNPAMRKVNVSFHLIMAFGSFYVTMIMSDWGYDGSSDTRWYGEPANTWLIILGQWFVMLFYLWILFAPKIFQNRQFSYAQY